MKEPEYVSAFAKAIEARPRKYHDVDVSQFFGEGDGILPQLSIRAPNKGEQDLAIDAAYGEVAKRTHDGTRRDEDVVRDTKALHIIHKAFFETEERQKPDKSGTFRYPAFPSPEWMKRFTTDQIGVLLNLLNEVRAAESPEPRGLDELTVETLHDAAVRSQAKELAAEFLAGCGREFVVQLYIAEAMRLRAARAELAKLQDELEASRGSAASPPEVNDQG